MAQTIEDVNSRTLLQQFHELYNKQNETETDVENLDTKIDQETIDRQSADLSINSEIQALKDQIDSLGVLFTFKGEVATIQDLPATDNKLGDVYYVDSEQAGYIWLEKDGTEQWEEFGPAIDLSEYAKQEDLEQLESEVDAMNTQVESNATNIVNLTNTKQDKLTAGTNITIDANNVISSSGLQKVTASDVDSEQATNGQVLTADGTGGASWKNLGGTEKIYLHQMELRMRISSGDYYLNIIIPRLTSTRLTLSGLASLLYNNGNKIYIPLNNIITIGSTTNQFRLYFSLTANSASQFDLKARYRLIDLTNGEITIVNSSNIEDIYSYYVAEV